MSHFELATMPSHLVLAVVLFFGVNWVGQHAVDFGYGSTTLFEDITENVALNFFLRAIAPAVFVVVISAISVAIGRPEWRLGIHWVAIYYYVIRALAIILLSRQRLVSWPRFALHAAAGVALAVLAYNYLILPNRSLLPDVETMGNELWLAIGAFLFAVANKVPVAGGPGARRRNNFVRAHYGQARKRYGQIIEKATSDELLSLMIYSVLIHEDYARPAAVRVLERLMFWKSVRSTGIMQVTGDRPLSDEESVAQGADRLSKSWSANATEEYLYSRVRMTIGQYNPDDDYISRVLEVMELLAKRVDNRFAAAYAKLWG